MALFVFGAGATRGCSFVAPQQDPCLPPLDADFFTQLQKVQNQKHQKLIKSVIQDVVEVFGQNFSVTMETVFTTYENTIQMLEITGENRDFKKRDLKDKRERLEQAIAVVFEDSLAEKDLAGHSRQTPKKCDHHNKFVREILKAGDDIISFNYDCVLDYSLLDHGTGKWDPRYGYSFKLGSRGQLLSGDKPWCPNDPPAYNKTVHLYKLHGSLHFQISGDETNPKVHLKQLPYTKQRGNMRFTIIPPEWHKAYGKGAFAKLWKDAASAIHKAKHIVLIGYSLPSTDLHSSALFRTSAHRKALKSLVIVNPNREARQRIRTIFQRALQPSTRVLSFDMFEHFVSADRSLWDL